MGRNWDFNLIAKWYGYLGKFLGFLKIVNEELAFSAAIPPPSLCTHMCIAASFTRDPKCKQCRCPSVVSAWTMMA